MAHTGVPLPMRSMRWGDDDDLMWNKHEERKVQSGQGEDKQT